MRNYTSFIFLFFISLFWGCKSEQSSNKVRITVHATNGKGQTVAVKSLDMLTTEEITLAETKFDSTGNASLEFEIPNTQFANVQIGEKPNPGLFSPSDDLDITLDLKDLASNPIFKGKAAEASKYLNLSAAISQKFDASYNESDSINFKKRYDSLKNGYSTLHKTFLDTTKASKEICSLLEDNNKLMMLYRKQVYAIPVLLGIQKDTEYPFFVRSINKEIPFDTTFLSSKIGIYAVILQIFTYTQSEGLSKGKNSKEYEEMIEMLPILGETKIKEGNYSVEMKDFLLAKNIKYWISTFGITASTKKIYENLRNTSKSKEQLSSLEAVYTKYYSLTEGKPAPNITGVTREGKKVSLTDFKGKIVYVDVWATWCGPCREELPKTRMIEKKYAGNDNVVFMYVSVDEDVEAWKALLKKDKNFKGIQINDVSNEQHKNIEQSYLIGGIPNYILIDQKGNIISSKAPRPSSGKVEALIDQYLTKKKPIS